MNVKKITVNKWKLLKDHGDIEKIVEESKSETRPNGISRVTIGHAMRTGQMNETTFEAINNFYKEKALRIEKAELKAETDNIN